MNSNATKLVANLLLSLATLSCCLLLAEVALRLIDGYSLVSPVLQQEATATRAGGGTFGREAAARYYLDELPLAAGADRSWYDLDPPAHELTDANTELFDSLAAEADQLGSKRPHMAARVWNRHFVDATMCESRHREAFAKYPETLYTFSLPSKSRHPHYRLPYRYRAKALNLVTNQFGFRSPGIELLKPGNTVRIAFVGASTTESSHGFEFTYPEFVVHWLNLWSADAGRKVRFEVINAGRGGINSSGIRAVVETEVLSFNPDYIVYYEGSNEFWPRVTLHEDPEDFKSGVRIPKSREAAADIELRVNRLPLAEHSAIMRRVDFVVSQRNPFLDGREPAKPKQKLSWPEHFDPDDPDITLAQLPNNGSRILSNLDDMLKRATANDARFVMTSFVWNVRDGMILEPLRDRTLYGYLNVTFWPFSYAVIEENANVQNRIFARWARANQVPFLDVARYFPKDPRLFHDAIHMAYSGIRLRAWIVFNQLLPVIVADLQRGEVPRPDERETPTHPGFPPLERTSVRCPAP